MVPKRMEEEVKIVPYNMAKYIIDPENWYLSTYCMDKEFNAVKNNPMKFLQIASKFKGFIGFDYTIYHGMQKVKQKEIMNLNLSLTYFCGKWSRKECTIPNIRIGNKKLSYEFLRAIPKKATIAIGSYGCIRSIQEQKVFKNFLSHILPILQPANVLVYGGHPDAVFKEFENDYHFIFCKEFRLDEYKGEKMKCQNM